MVNGEGQRPSPKISKAMLGLAFIVVLLGLLLVLWAIHVEETHPIMSAVLVVVGLTMFVTVSSTLVHFYFLYNEQRNDMLQAVKKELKTVLESRIDIIDRCQVAGFDRVYSKKWLSFCDEDLPQYLGAMKRRFVAVGISLSGMGVELMGREMRETIRGHLRDARETKKFVFCIVKPRSAASEYRDKELLQRGDHGDETGATNYHADASLHYLRRVPQPAGQGTFEIKVFEEVVPKAAMVCIDDEIIFYSPYFSSSPTPTAWVVETRKGSAFFEQLYEDLDHLVEQKATPWRHSGDDDGPSEVGGSGRPQTT